jgi:hypothetical protein
MPLVPLPRELVIGWKGAVAPTFLAVGKSTPLRSGMLRDIGSRPPLRRRRSGSGWRCPGGPPRRIVTHHSGVWQNASAAHGNTLTVKKRCYSFRRECRRRLSSRRWSPATRTAVVGWRRPPVQTVTWPEGKGSSRKTKTGDGCRHHRSFLPPSLG